MTANPYKLCLALNKAFLCKSASSECEHTVSSHPHSSISANMETGHILKIDHVLYMHAYVGVQLQRHR